MPEKIPTPEHYAKASGETAKEVVLFIFSLVLGILMLYVIFYWGFYRGGGYILHHAIQPSLHDENRRKTVGEALKVLWTLTGASIGAVIGIYVRQFFVIRALDHKIRLIAALRNDVLKTLERPTTDALPKIALDGETVKYVLNEKDYGSLAKYLAPSTVLNLLRTVSAVQAIAAVIKEAEMQKVAPTVPPYAREQLEKFDAAALHAALQPFQQVQQRFREQSEAVAEDTLEPHTSEE